jgi:hypothetical protein
MPYTLLAVGDAAGFGGSGVGFIVGLSSKNSCILPRDS